MKKIILLILVFSSVCIISCNNNAGDPQSVLSQFFDAMSKKDIATTRKLATEESKSMLDLMEMGMKMDSSTEASEKYDKSKMEFSEPKIDGDKATITVKEKKSGESMNFTLKKEKGSWKVAFDKASMMNMGMEKMKDKGIDPSGESMEKAINNMKDIGLDSMEKGINESLQKLDSVSKELKKLEDK